MSTRTYTELSRLRSFEERFNYLKIFSRVGRPTFGFDRYLNQRFYTSVQWRRLRNRVIARDLGCDLGLEGYEIHFKPIIHHMNPMEADDIRSDSPEILDPEFLITVTPRTHNAIHFGDASLLNLLPPERKPGDTKLW